MELKRIRILWILRACTILAGAAFICLGAARGEIAVVLRKAVRICLECIGVAG